MVREYRDGVPPSDGIKYQLVTDGSNRTKIDNVTEWEVSPSEFGASNAMHDMLLGCDAELSANIITISHPSGAPVHFWFEAPCDYLPTQVYQFQSGEGEPEMLTVTSIAGHPLEEGAWASGAVVCLSRLGGRAFFKTGGGVRTNYDVVGGTTRPQAKENRFWVYTEQPVTGYCLLDDATVEELPGKKLPGTVAIAMKGAQYPFAAFLGNKGYVGKPSKAYQLDSTGANWVNRSMSFYHDGAWREFNIDLYYYGAESIVIGSWVGYGNGYAKQPQALYMASTRGPSGTYYYGAFTTSKPIDLTGFSTAKFRFRFTGGNGTSQGGVFGFSKTQYPTSTGQLAVVYSNHVNGTYESSLNVAGLTGDYYPIFQTWNTWNLLGTTMYADYLQLIV